MGNQRTKVGVEHEVEALANTAAQRAPVAPTAQTRTEAEMARLQRTVGNRAAIALLRAGQAKLEVGPADDPYEREADQVAREVVSNLRHGSPVETAELEEEEMPVQRVSRISRVQRAALPEVGLEGGDLDTGTESAIQSARGSSGRPLPTGARRKFESAFGGADLSGVRLHAGPAASELNERVSAKAFTIGRDIFFHGPAPSTETESGQELLAHELTHTIQQDG